MRKIIKIDEEKCDGCGLCADACHEGAIVIENGKAKLISDSYCDGLGDCIGECPQGAISFEMREAAAYDEAAVKARMAARKKEPCSGTLPCGCPGSMAKELKSDKPVQKEEKTSCRQESELRNWPVQLSLVPVQAPYLEGAKLLLAADCTAFACPNFHKDLLPGKVCLVGCPKLDEVEPYIEKLAQIIKLNGIEEIDVAYMEVPCCGGLELAAKKALQASGKFIPWQIVTISLDGKIWEYKERYYE